MASSTAAHQSLSPFTIADGVVQHLLVQHLFHKGNFRGVVGEESQSKVNITEIPYFVDDLVIPDSFYDDIESTKTDMEKISAGIDPEFYKDLTIFIDPIDGTREFSTGLGEQSSICIGFSNSLGHPVAGFVFRPITSPVTFAGGCAEEGLFLEQLDRCSEFVTNGFLTSNGTVSPFISALVEELQFCRIKAGGAGNKMLMLLEGKGSCYIQDRGVSRWDTCAAQAVIEAHGGQLGKLTSFLKDGTLESYTYLEASTNLDFEPGVAQLTRYNSAKCGGTPELALIAESVKVYANLSGLCALGPSVMSQKPLFLDAVRRVLRTTQPSFD